MSRRRPDSSRAALGFRHGASMFVLAVATTACGSIDEAAAGDRRDVTTDAFTRAAVVAPATDESVDESVRALLAEPLTEDAAVKIAMLRNGEIRAALAELGIARADLVQAGLLSNPVFGALALFYGDGTEIELSLTQSFVDVFHRPLRRAIAAAQLDGAKAHVTRLVVRTAFDVRRAFVNVRAAAQITELHRQDVAAAAASEELMRLLHDAGNVVDPQRTTVELTHARARLGLASAELAEREAREPLNVLMGLFGAETGWTVEGRMQSDALAGLDVDRVETRAVTASLDLAANRAHADAAAQRAGLSDWQTWFDGAHVGIAAGKEREGSAWGVGPELGIPIPLFDQGRATRHAASADLQAALHRHTSLGVEVRASARRLRDRTQQLAARAAFVRDVALPLQQRLLRETIRDFNAMQIGAFDVLSARQMHLAAARESLTALRDAWLSRLDLEELLAGSLNRARAAATPAHGEPANVGAPDRTGGH